MQTQEQFVSQAYLPNLAETYIEKVEFDKKYEPLIHAFQSFPALKNQFENLLKEVFHPYRNTHLVLEEFRLFLLNNDEFFDQFLQLLFDLLYGFYGEEKDINTKVRSRRLLVRYLKLAKIKEFKIKLYDWITLNGMTRDVYYGKIADKVV